MMSSLRMAAVGIAAALLVLASPVVAQPQHNVTFSTYRSMAAQLRSTPFDPHVRDAILVEMAKTMSMYTFIDLNIDSSIGAPPGTDFFAQKHDILASMATIGQTTYASQYDMECAFGNLFSVLNDAHTAYSKSLYAPYAFTLPFRLNSILASVPKSSNNPQTHIYLSSTLNANIAYKQAYGYSPLVNATDANGAPVHLDSIEGFEVVTIQGKPAVQFLWDLAGLDSPHQVGTSKDQSTRYNLLTHGFTASPTGPPGYYSYRSQFTFGIPDQATEEIVTMTLLDPNDPKGTVYTIPFQWLGMQPSNGAMDFSIPKPTLKNHAILRQQQIEDHYYQIHSLQHPAMEKQRIAMFGRESVKKPTKRTPKVTKVDAAYIKKSLEAGQSDFSIPGEISFTVLPDNTGVLQIFNFEPTNNVDFLSLIQMAVTNHQLTLKGTKLIIDLRGNGGGDICLGYSVIRFLFPQILQPTFAFDAADSPFGLYDTIQAPLTQYLADLGEQNQMQQLAYNQCAFFTPCGWINPLTQTPYANEAWYNNGRTLNRGGKSAPYTGLFHDNCASYFSTLAPSDINPGYQPKNVVMVSDGMCGSTCSVFSSYIQMHNLAKTVTFGGVVRDGITVRPQQFWSFPGGQVATVEELQMMAYGYGVPTNDTRMPQMYPTGSIQSWTLREIYPWNDPLAQYPLEFLHVPADFNLGYLTTFTNATAIYSILTQTGGPGGFFGDQLCVVGITNLPCVVPNGVGQLFCQNGMIQQICIPQWCDAGYEYDQPSKSCLPCAIGTYRLPSQDPTQQQCVPCSPVVTISIPTDQDVNCTGVFSQTGVTSDNCPYEVTCQATGVGPTNPDNGSSGVSKGLFVGVTVGFLILCLILLLTIVRLARKQRVSSTIDAEFSRMTN